MQIKKKTKTPDCDGSPTEKKTKIHAQRKFAQGAYNFTATKDKDKENGSLLNPQSSQPVDPPNEELLDACPSTEDFLTFLCYRSLPGALPESLSYFADPARHNYPNGILPSERKSAATKGRSKENGLNGSKKNSIVPKQFSKDNKKGLKSKHRKVSVVSQKRLGMGRIHSNFRRTNMATGALKRLNRPQQTNKDTTVKKASIKKTVKTCKEKPTRIVETEQRRTRGNISPPYESTNSENESSEEELTPKKVPKKSLAKIKVELEKSLQNCKQVKTKALSKANNIVKPVSCQKITRASAPQLLGGKSLRSTESQRHARASHKELRRKSAPIEPLRATSHISTRLRSATVSQVLSPVRTTRKSSEKLNSYRNPSELVISPVRRPMRRTKEAATIYMTILGQEEELDSSELEDATLEKNKRAEKRPSSVVQLKEANNRRVETSVEKIMTRTRRNCLSATNSPLAKRRATILREAAKRFTAVQSDTETSSSSESNLSSSENSSSDEEISVPKRSIRTRSFDPSLERLSNESSGLGRRRSERDVSSKLQQKKNCLKPSSSGRSMNGKPAAKAEEKKFQEKVEPEKPDSKNRKRATSKRPETPPLNNDLESLLEAPVFHPSEKEFSDPMEYLEKIRPECERFGICRIIPPVSFKPECQVSDAMRFTAYNQYIHRMFRRKGPNTRILLAIQRHLKSMGIDYQQAPCIGGIEVDLPGLYEAVEELGGPGFVLQNNLWSKVADKMKIPRAAQDRLSKLDSIYCKFLLPYATMSAEEKNKLLQRVDTLQARKSSGEDEDECVVKGNSIALSAFYRIARNTLSVWFPSANPTAADSSVDPVQIEAKYWQLVTERTAHLCVHCGNIDSGQAGYGFPCNKTSRHPWNLKVLTNHTGSVLRSLGSVAGCTAPTLNVNMLFSASCWYRDPHGLPWIDYLHTGADKIWYGVPSMQEPVLRRAMTKLVPDLVNSEKSVWLSSDTVMIPPTMLADEGVNLSRTIQKSGQFIVVWPQAFTSSLSTGYSVSENVFFAPPEWLPIGESCFKELRENCEPTVFSLQQLLWNIAHDSRSTADVLKLVLPMLQRSIDEELELRSSLRNFGVQQWEKIHRPAENGYKSEGKKRRQQPTIDEGDMECDECLTSLFFSRAEYQTQSKPPVTWCLAHALEKIKERPRITQNVKVLHVYDQSELREAVQHTKDQIRAKTVRSGTLQRTVTV